MCKLAFRLPGAVAASKQPVVTLQLSNAPALATAATAGSQAASAWPNPFADELTVALPGSFEVAVYARDGRLLSRSAGTSGLRVGTSLATGAYLLKISQPG